MADTTAPQAPQQDTGVFGTLKRLSDGFVVSVVNFGRSREAKDATVTPTTSVDGGTIPAQGESATQYTSTVLPPRAEQPAPAKTSAAQEAYAKTEAAIIEQVAIGLKTNGNIVTMAGIAGVGIEPPQSNDEYRRIAKELIENRQFSIKDKDGNPAIVKIDDMDKYLLKMAEKSQERYDEEIKKLGAKSFNEKIPDASRRSKIAQAVSDSVEENTGSLPFLGGASFMNSLMGLFQWIMSGFEGGFDGLKSNIANITADSTSKSVEGKLRALGESQENIQTISDEVRTKALEKAGYPSKDAKKPTKLEDIQAAPLSTQQPATAPPSPSLGAPAPTVIPPAVPSPTPSAEASPDITITAGAAAALAAGALERQIERERSATKKPTVSLPQAQNTATTANEKLNRTVAGIAEKLFPKGIENREGLVKDTTVILAKIVEENKNLINNPTELGKIAAKELLDPATNKGNPETPEGRVATALSNSARKEGVTTLEGALKGIERLEIYPVMFPDLETGKPKLITPGKVLHEGYEGLEKIIGKQFAENSKGLQEAAGVVTTTSTQAATITVPAVPAPAQVPTTVTSKPTVPVVPIVPNPVKLESAPPTIVPPSKHKEEHKKKHDRETIKAPKDAVNTHLNHASPAQVVPPPAPQQTAAPQSAPDENLRKTVKGIVEKLVDSKSLDREALIADTVETLTPLIKKNASMLNDPKKLATEIASELLKPPEGKENLRTAEGRVAKGLRELGYKEDAYTDYLIKNGLPFKPGLIARTTEQLSKTGKDLNTAIAQDAAALERRPVPLQVANASGTPPSPPYTQGGGGQSTTFVR